MNPNIIRDWLQDQANCLAANLDASSLKRTRPDSGDNVIEMSSPKRPRMRSPDATAASSQDHGRGRGIARGSFPRMPYRAQRPPFNPPGRSPSPTKPTTIVDLAKLESPVRFVYPHNVFSTVLDEAGKTLWCDLMALSRDEKVLPQAIRQDLESLIGSKAISDSMWDTSPQQANEAAAKAELDKILQLTLDTKLAEQRRKSEAGWNEDVHKPVLRLALALCPVVQAETVSSAKLVPAFHPPLADAGGHESSAPDVQSSATGTDMGSGKGGGVTYHRIVDYVLTLDAERAQSNSDVAIYQSLTRQITAFVDGQPRAERWINAVQYEPLRYIPAGVAIGTKTHAGSREEAMVQLGVWVAAWHHRLRAMTFRGWTLPAEPWDGQTAGQQDEPTDGRTAEQQEEPVPPDNDNNKPPRIPALPVITVFNGSWELALAVDLDVDVAGQNQPRKETHIVGPSIPIGNTYTVRGTYRLLASLRRLATWMEQDYRPWLEATLSWAGYE